ncbi:MAG: hypothetical protein M1269_09265 [Chloroflexi bacterium]|nr:hypothetical protein [Chloroflexota bacterium]
MRTMIGILAGNEEYANKVIGLVNRRGEGKYVAEHIKLGAQIVGEPIPYKVILDRLSHVLVFFSPYLKRAALQGAKVINDPFRFPADDKFYDGELAARLGVSVPRTVLLPTNSPPAELPPDDFTNLGYPLDWEEIADYVGFPAVLKPYDGYGWREVHRLESLGDLMWFYNSSGDDTCMVQQWIEFDHYIRCFVIGMEEVMPISYNPVNRTYILDHEHLTPLLGERVENNCRDICKGLGYDFNTVEFAIKDGIPYAIDFMNPVPDCSRESLGDHYFDWVVEQTADLLLKEAAKKSV